MKSVIAICALLVASVSAAPVETSAAQQVTVALSNDQSGAYAGVTLAADHTDHTIYSLFGSTSVGSNGRVFASSVQLTQFPANIQCVIKNEWVTFATLTAQHTYSAIDGTSNAANLGAAVINCHV